MIFENCCFQQLSNGIDDNTNLDLPGLVQMRCPTYGQMHWMMQDVQRGNCLMPCHRLTTTDNKVTHRHRAQTTPVTK